MEPDYDKPKSKFEMVPRNVWGGEEMPYHPRLNLPVKLVVIAYIIKDYKTNRDSPGHNPDSNTCMNEMRFIELGDQFTTNDDIRYNFVVCTDGYAYEGRGWTKVPFLPAKYKYLKNQCIYIGYLGDYSEHEPPPKLFSAKEELIKMGIMEGYISPKFLEMELPNPWKIKRERKKTSNYISTIYL